MKTLLVISHGSRRSASNAEVFKLTDRLREQAGAKLDRITCAFLEIAEPGVQTAIDELVEDGATEILVLPHFLAAGTHVANDIPRKLAEARAIHPGVTLTLLPHLGALSGVPSLILDQLGHE